MCQNFFDIEEKWRMQEILTKLKLVVSKLVLETYLWLIKFVKDCENDFIKLYDIKLIIIIIISFIIN